MVTTLQMLRVMAQAKFSTIVHTQLLRVINHIKLKSHYVNTNNYNGLYKGYYYISSLVFFYEVQYTV